MNSDFENKFENLDINIKGVRLPEIEIPQRYKDQYGPEHTSNTSAFLRQLCREGYKAKIKNKSPIYVDRIKRELETIDELGFTDYILLVWDVINFCRENDIPVGKGRGSAAGSLVLYILNVTDINPIENSLIFERFISKVRAKSSIIDGIRYIDGSLAPDIDLDICTVRRGEVIEYLKNKYPGKFCKLPTLSTLATKQVVKDVCKIFLSLEEDDALYWTKQIEVKYGKPFSIEETMAENPLFEGFCESNPEFLKCALTLENMVRQKGSHASAFLVSHDDLDSFLPLELDTHGELTSSWDMNYSQQECIKLDLLGLHGVTLIDNIKKACGNNFDDFDPNDKFIYESSVNTDLPYGLFQIGAGVNWNVFKQVKPSNWSELSAVIALARPGALAYVEDYCKNEYSEHFNNTSLKEILGATHNVPLYQEQMMVIANQVFGFTLEDAETLRRIVGKKKVKEMVEWEPKIYSAAEEKGLPKELAEFYWNLLNESANYSFNASHSFSYSYLSALTLFLKFKHPKEFYCECLKMAEKKADSQEHVGHIETELKYFGIELLPPDFLKSKESFYIEGDNIRYGFSCIKGVSDKSLPQLKKFLSIDKTNKFEVFNAAQEAKLNIGVLCALIQAGMMSSVAQNREKLVFEAQLWNLLTDREKTYCLEVGEDHDYDIINMVRNINSWVDINGKNISRKTRLDTIKKNVVKYKEIYAQNTKYPKFASWYYENTLLGYSYSTTLKSIFNVSGKKFINIAELQAMESGNFEGVYQVLEEKKGVSKANGNRYINITLKDESGTFRGMLIGKKYEDYLENGHLNPKKGSILAIQGTKPKGGDLCWINNMTIQDNKTYLKLSDIHKQ